MYTVPRNLLCPCPPSGTIPMFTSGKRTRIRTIRSKSGSDVAVLTTLAPGAAVGKYLVVREIGRGGMGVVYLAEDTTLSREVALKLLYPSLSTDTVFVDRFKQEARVVAAILHPNIVRINSFETLPEGLAIDMEYVSGPSLGHMMAHEVFTPQLAVQIARDVLEGLAVCHELGVVHRDIKPNNILFAPDGRAKLADFGLATAYATHLESSIYRMSSSGFFMGTPRFAPPEAWEGGHPHPNWDLYSLGLVMYEGLIGRPVYTGTTPLAIVKQLTSGAIGPLRDVAPTVSPELGAFVDRLVSHDQSTRPVDAPAALLELRALPEFDNSNGVGPPTVQMAVRNVRRKSTALRWARKTRTGIFRAAAVAAVAASGAAAFWLTWGTSTAPAPDASAPPARVLASQEELAENNLL
ncbi:MAG: serine/threonine protein kinase, partial [Candidatus Hydrogenedentes bacterium]|nr:serine/threonine protein kinase [Candidatus Hydrogenedentota bacterium]